MSVPVKICGLTTARMVEVAVDAGAHAIGLVLSASPRRVGRSQAARLLEAIPDGVERIAVLRSPGGAERAALAVLAFDGVQVDARHAAATPLPRGAFLLPSFRDDDGLEARLAARADAAAARPSRPHEPPCAVSLRGAVLFDGPQGGGRGVEPDRERARRLAATPGVRLVLAGGLRPDIVGERLRAVRPFAVDVSSGVESAPGVKDAGLVRAFLEAVREASPRSTFP